MVSNAELTAFLVESNHIEGIEGPITGDVLETARSFLRSAIVTVDSLVGLVNVLQPDAKLRTHVGLDVRVGNHVPPPGGENIFVALDTMLDAIQIDPPPSPYEAHRIYETLHPFTDGNGRSGRLLWLWMMGENYRPDLGFLHTWYYQSLSANREPMQ